jgi:hypothetical protein
MDTASVLWYSRTMTIVDQWKEFKLERLTSDATGPDGERKPLGIVMAFAEANVTDRNSEACNMMSSFIHGARGEGYSVLLINNAGWAKKQSIVKPKMDTSDGLIWTFALPWLKSPLAKDAASPVKKIEDFSRQYDFVILGLNNDGLFDFDLCEEPVFFDVTNIVDRFVFSCAEVIPQSVQHKSVTYVPANIHESYALGLISFDANREHASVLTIEHDGRPRINYGRRIARVAHPDIPPVAFQQIGGGVHALEAYQKISFGALLGLVPQELIYCDEELANHYKENSVAEGIVGWGGALVTYGAVNAATIMTVGMSEAFIFSGIFGVVPAFFAAFASTSGYERFKRRLKKFTQTSNTQELPDMTQVPLIGTSKSFPAFTVSVIQDEEPTSQPLQQATQTTNTTVNIKTVKRLYDQSIHRYNEIRDRWLDYELDIIKFLDAPLMRDLTYEPTAQFFTHMHRAQNLAEILSQSTDYDADIVDRFESFVAEMSLAFERAESAAVQTGADFLTPDKRKEFETATRLLTLANSESASPSERSSSLDQGRKMLNKSGVTAPAVVYGLLEGKIRMIEPSCSDQETDVQA